MRPEAPRPGWQGTKSELIGHKQVMSNDPFFDDFSEVTDDMVVTALSRPAREA